MGRIGAIIAVLMVAACMPAIEAPRPAPLPDAATVLPPVMTPQGLVVPPRAAAETFVQVVARVEPMAELACQALAARGTDCAFDIRVDPRPDQEPNAFQTLDPRGRPVIVFTLSLISAARNADELAFVLGHEAAHHIAGHIPRRMQTAERGALLGAVYGSVTGADAATMAQLQRMGAEIGARRYSKEFELEADALGAQIAWRAGYDPVRGTGFFERLPDPGDQFLGSHPQNAQRSAQVAAVVAELERGAIR